MDNSQMWMTCWGVERQLRSGSLERGDILNRLVPTLANLACSMERRIDRSNGCTDFRGAAASARETLEELQSDIAMLRSSGSSFGTHVVQKTTEEALQHAFDTLSLLEEISFAGDG